MLTLPELVFDPFFMTMAFLAVFITGLSKGGFGGGLGVMAVPLMTLAISPVLAAAVLLPVLISMDFAAIRGFRHNLQWRMLQQLLPGALLGITLGALTFSYMSESALKLLVATMTLLFCLNAFIKMIRRIQVQPRQQHFGTATFWSTLSGFASFSVHAGGPPMSFYLLPLKLDKSVYVATTIVFFTSVNLIKVVPYIGIGLFTRESLLISLCLVPFALLGVKAGVLLHNKVNETLFYRACYVLLFITGAKLFNDGLMGIGLY